MLHFSKCAAFFLLWRILSSVPHFCKCSAFFQGRDIFSSVRHFSKCAKFFQVRRIFPSVAPFSKFSKRTAFFQVRRIFPSLAQFSKCAAFVQVWRNFSSVRNLDLSGKSHDTHKCLERKWIGCVRSTHIHKVATYPMCGGPDGVGDITPRLLRGDAGSNPAHFRDL